MVTVLARNLGVRSTSLPEPLALGLTGHWRLDWFGMTGHRCSVLE